MDKKVVKKNKLKKPYKVIIGGVLSIATLLLWSRYISTSGLIVKEYKVVNDKLPATFHGLKVVHFSDVHYGRTINDSELKKIVNKINVIKPDIVIFTGDLIDRDVKLTVERKDAIIDNLTKIEALYGKYAITGNHDTVFKDYQQILAESHFIDLNNTYDIIYNKKLDSIYIGGLETEVDGHPDIDAITEAFNTENNDQTEQKKEDIVIPSYKILIMHTPDTYPKIESYDFNLVLAGHSHNGQVRIPFIGATIKPPGAQKYYLPYYKINNTDFYISSGLGTSVINFRFLNKPSINFYRLTTK